MTEPASHCPAVKAADIIGDKWTLLILRAMMLGATRYSDFQAAVPRISPSVLSGRLKQLAENGLILRRGTSGQSASYRLTPSGRECEPIVFFLAQWGLRWAERNIRDENIDIGSVMWDFHKTLNIDELPDGETVISISLNDVGRHAKWWIVASRRTVDLCNDDPGKDVDLYIASDLATIIELWMGEKPVKAAIEEEAMLLTGEAHLMQSASRWFPLSPVAKAQQEGALPELPVAAA
jgi:DNA-binding HxlR family transcriptional regulator